MPFPHVPARVKQLNEASGRFVYSTYIWTLKTVAIRTGEREIRRFRCFAVFACDDVIDFKGEA